MSFLSVYFKGAAAKILTAVEIDTVISNQHEFNGVQGLKSIFGSNKISYSANFIYIDKNGAMTQDEGLVTWYDAREANPKRTEYRLYYTKSDSINHAKVNDSMVVGLRSDNKVLIIIANQHSDFFEKIKVLFGIDNIDFDFQNVQVDTKKIMEDDKQTLQNLGVGR